MAANIMPFFVVMCEFFNGVLQPVSLMPPVWRYTMYYIGPFTYWIGGIAAMILSPIGVACRDSELSRFNPPPNNTCLEYSESWLSGVNGYLDNPDATSDCGYCQYASGEDVSTTALQRRCDETDMGASICQQSVWSRAMLGRIWRYSCCLL